MRRKCFKSIPPTFETSESLNRRRLNRACPGWEGSEVIAVLLRHWVLLVSPRKAGDNVLSYISGPFSVPDLRLLKERGMSHKVIEKCDLNNNQVRFSLSCMYLWLILMSLTAQQTITLKTKMMICVTTGANVTLLFNLFLTYQVEWSHKRFITTQ